MKSLLLAIAIYVIALYWLSTQLPPCWWTGSSGCI
ncbi:hypothetical protein ABIB89_003299 [Bradyrhizobium sp. JR3.12]